MNAKDIMTTPVITVQPDTAVPEIARILLERRISGVPVIDSDSRVAGVVSEADLMHRHDPEPGCSRHSWVDYLFRAPDDAAHEYIRTHGRHAEEIMSAPVVTIVEDTPVHEISRLLEKRHVKRLPVLRDQMLVGIVSRSDLLTGLATDDESKSADIVVDDSAIQRHLEGSLNCLSWFRSPYCNFSVENGMVRFWGLVGTSEQGKALELVAERTPGVKGVINRLSLIEPYFYYGE